MYPWTDETPRRWRLPLLALGVVFTLLQVWSVFTEAVNWDETALFDRAVTFVRTGVLQGGGRPGLAELLIAPFAEGCRDVVSGLRGARLVWVAITLALVAGLYQVTRHTLGALSSPRTDALFALTALVGIPVFQVWSVHVRTDQPAIAAALWGGVALVTSRQHWRRAVVAGVLIMLGGLFSQKAIYVAALVGLLTAIELWIADDAAARRWRAVVARLLLTMLGGALVFACYRLVLPLFVELPARVVTMESGLSVFAFYRKAVGYGTYISMLPTLVPFWIVGVFAARAAAMKSGSHSARRALVGAHAVLALGVAVGLFHAGAFPYFWMTLGLFPAIAAALALEAIRASLPELRAQRLAAALTVGVFLVQGLGAAVLRLEDDQGKQRESLAFVERNIPAAQRGFQLRGELACRKDPAPFRTLFMQHVEFYFNGPESEEHIDRMIEEFRARPVSYMLETQWLGRFPTRLVRFWKERFIPYSAALQVQGRRLGGNQGTRTEFEVLETGRFRWLQDSGDTAARLIIDERDELQPGEERVLRAGVHRLELKTPRATGRLVASLPEEPGRTWDFY